MPQQKFHPRNKHQSRYDFAELTLGTPELKAFLIPNPKGDQTIDFHDPEAVKILNKALLKHFYQIENWEIPEGYLCPPVPGRADYIHSVADLLMESNEGKIPKGNQIKALDIGLGANCIYPIIGAREYGWSFIGSEIDSKAIASAQKIIDQNPVLKNKIELRFQSNLKAIFLGIFKSDEYIDFTICNPPFHASAREAQKGTKRKLKNLKQKKAAKPTLNFGGKNNELWCEGGERKFIEKMITESTNFSTNCFWFTTLVSKQSNLKPIEFQLKKVNAKEVKTIPISHGNKSSRIVAWTFLNKKQQAAWRSIRWK